MLCVLVGFATIAGEVPTSSLTHLWSGVKRKKKKWQKGAEEMRYHAVTESSAVDVLHDEVVKKGGGEEVGIADNYNSNIHCSGMNKFPSRRAALERVGVAVQLCHFANAHNVLAMKRRVSRHLMKSLNLPTKQSRCTKQNVLSCKATVDGTRRRPHVRKSPLVARQAHWAFIKITVSRVKLIFTFP